MLPIPKEIRDEAQYEALDLKRRFIELYSDVTETFETERYIGFRYLVRDESTGITRTLLDKLGYKLEPSDYNKCYWITLRTRFDKPKRKR